MSKTLAKFGTGAFGYGEFGIRDDDEPRSKPIEQVVADGLGPDWQASDYDAGFKISISIEQSLLAGSAKI